jgi:hypothetical protein
MEDFSAFNVSFPLIAALRRPERLPDFGSVKELFRPSLKRSLSAIKESSYRVEPITVIRAGYRSECLDTLDLPD